MSKAVRKKQDEAPKVSNSSIAFENKKIASSKNNKKGFASMSPQRVEEIAKKGGQARAAQLGHAGFVELGRKGGEARAEQLGHQGFVELGRKGGKARADQRRLQTLKNKTSLISSDLTLNDEEASVEKDNEIVPCDNSKL